MEENTTQEEAQLPPVDFVSFTTDLITTAHLYLQGFRDPETEKVIVNLGLAKRVIDTLEMLEEKTKGNLTAPEANFLANSLYDLRMGYVRAVNSQPDTPEQDESEDAPEQETPNEDNSSTETDQTEQVIKEEENTDF
ncbi:MAG: DUF1844 domain-containing protein [Candidatus Poribacteria bacterium]|nr:DUF1844 domain-containing protein [Candidatus Poribacteria bacterium]